MQRLLRQQVEAHPRLHLARGPFRELGEDAGTGADILREDFGCGGGLHLGGCAVGPEHRDAEQEDRVRDEAGHGEFVLAAELGEYADGFDAGGEALLQGVRGWVGEGARLAEEE